MEKQKIPSERAACKHGKISMIAIAAVILISVTTFNIYTEGKDSLLEIGNSFESSAWDLFLNNHPKKTGQGDWYLLVGELELVDLGQIKMYGLRQGERAVILGQDRNIDYYYSGLRGNLGKRIVVGSEWLSRAAFVGQAAWTSKMSKAGYFKRHSDFLTAFPHLIYGLSRSQEQEYYSQHYGAFKVLAEKAGLVIDSGRSIVDPDRLPKGSLFVVVITPVGAVLSAQKANLEVKIEGPVVRSVVKENVPTAYAVSVEFADIPEGTYIVTATYLGAKLKKQIEIRGHVQEFQMVMQ